MHLSFIQCYEETVNKVTSEYSTAKNVKKKKKKNPSHGTNVATEQMWCAVILQQNFHVTLRELDAHKYFTCAKYICEAK